MERSICLAGVLGVMGLVLAGCTTAPKSAAGRASLIEDADAALARMKREDLGLEKLLDRSYAHAIFPSVGKGAVWIGGAYGKGLVYEQGEPVGYSDLSQATIGLQLGGQTYSELVLFEEREILERFKSGSFTFAANASAVALKAGASAAAEFKDGMAVFTMPTGGLMFEAAIGGQKFNYVPMD